MKTGNSAIANKNDLMRKTFINCRIILTESVKNLDDKTQSLLIESIQKFNNFTEENDPYGEHDFGSVIITGIKYFWKFDYFDDAYEGFMEDGNRVLTIMRADEY